MLLKRDSGIQLYEGVSTGEYPENTKVIDVAENTNQKDLIFSSYVCGAGSIPKSTSIILPKPNGQGATDWVQVTVAVTGEAAILYFEDGVTPQSILLTGSEDSPGIHQFNVYDDAIYVSNQDSDAIKVSYMIVQLPDITDEDNFRGLQTDGTQSEVS